MTDEEKLIHQYADEYDSIVVGTNNQSEGEEAYIVVEALHKQIRWKPHYPSDRSSRSADCRRCGKHLPIQHFPYCPHCGQRVNWSLK